MTPGGVQFGRAVTRMGAKSRWDASALLDLRGLPRYLVPSSEGTGEGAVLAEREQVPEPVLRPGLA
eukprot:12897332-Prorocentrum_lima.AAC.1